MIKFSKYIWLYFFISALVIVPGVYSLIRWGLAPSIDFSGGSLVEIKTTSSLTQETISSFLLDEGLEAVSIQPTDSTVIVRLKPVDEAMLASFEDRIASAASEAGAIARNETVGPVLGSELLTKAVTAAIIAILVILVYVAYAFKNIKFGISAIIALFHDLLVVLGLFSLFGHFMGVEVDTLFVTAFLTTMSFSVHDTIVVFDRIRELQRKGARTSFENITDTALTETMGRSLANSFTILFMLLALVLMGGENIRWFVVALLIGTVSGTYSSPFIATPILILLDRWEKRKKKS